MSVLAEHYDFTEEPGFIINYDIRYRMWDELRKTTSIKSPYFCRDRGGVKNLTDRKEMFPVGKKMI